MRHHASPKFWRAYEQLPEEIQRLADKSFELRKQDPQHPSLHFKKTGRFLSARAGLFYRALGVMAGGDVVWFWIGRLDEYEQLISSAR